MKLLKRWLLPLEGMDVVNIIAGQHDRGHWRGAPSALLQDSSAPYNVEPHGQGQISPTSLLDSMGVDNGEVRGFQLSK